MDNWEYCSAEYIKERIQELEEEKAKLEKRLESYNMKVFVCKEMMEAYSLGMIIVSAFSEQEAKKIIKLFNNAHPYHRFDYRYIFESDNLKTNETESKILEIQY